MSGRFWVYLAAAIIIAAELSFFYGGQARITRQITDYEAASFQQTRADMENYLTHQSDARKMVSLAKRLAHSNPRLIELIVARAYELNPNSRDIAVLLSAFRPEIKKRVEELDPLYEFKKK